MNDIKHIKSLCTFVTENDLAEAWTDEFGVKYSADRKRLLRVNNALTSYSIRKGTVIICDESFSYDFGNRSIKSISIPNTVICIGYAAFRDCEILSQINLPDSLEEIGESAFSGCKILTNINIPVSVSRLGDRAFYGCESLTQINIPESITRIGAEVFGECAITQITIPNSVTTIGFFAFHNCKCLTNIDIPDSVVQIEDGAFAGCCSMKHIDLPNSITDIGNEVFQRCAFSEFIIPDSIHRIGNRAFWDCDLTHIAIPNTVSVIEEGAFYGCPLKQVTIPNSISKIENETFYECFALKEVNIPNSVTVIGNSAFYGCEALENIELPDSLEKIGDYAFLFCQELRNINIPNSVNELGKGVFGNCYSLEQIELHNSVTCIGDKIFNECEKLLRIIIPIGSRVKFEELLPDYKDKLIEQDNGWTVKKSRCFDTEEMAAIARAEVVPSPDGRNVCFFMMSGGRTYIPLIESSKLTVGDTLDLTKVKIVTLHKGKKEITRIMDTTNYDERHNLEEQQLQAIKKDNNHILFMDPHQYNLSEIKPDAELIAKYLNNNFQKYLYHFTHKDNLEQIKEMGGLYSWVQLEKMGKTCQHPGGNTLSRELDCRYGVADYVHLSFSHDHPMSYRKEDIVVLYIHPIVSLLPDTLFCNMNATDKKHIIGSTYKDLVNINLWTPKMGYLSSGTRLFKEKQAEVLVKSHIPLEYIVNINLLS